MPLFYNISVINAGYYNPPQTLFVGANPYGGNTIYGNGYGDTIYGESQGSLYAGSIGDNTIYGGGGSNTIYGDAYGLYDTVTAVSNTIWADNPFANDGSAVNVIYGNAFVMGGDSVGGIGLYGGMLGNNIYDSYGQYSYLYGNAYYMTDHSAGGHNTIEAVSVGSTVYGDAIQISGSTSADSSYHYGVLAGGNTIYLLSHSGVVYGDASFVDGTFAGGHNAIHLIGGNQQSATVYGTAFEFEGLTANGTISCGSNVIAFGGGDYTIYGDAAQNDVGSIVFGGNNTVVAGSGNVTIYGDCESNYGLFHGGGNTLNGSSGGGNTTIYGDCASNAGTFYGGNNTIYAGDDPLSSSIHGNSIIYGDCASNTGTFHGGYNTIYAETANATMYGSATGGYNTFIFTPGTGIDQIGSRNADGSVFQGFDQEGGVAFNHAQGDVIDLSVYHLGGFQNLVIGASSSGDAVIYLPPPAGGSQEGQITLIGIHPQDLTASDFHL
jgi:hypothetical protein